MPNFALVSLSQMSARRHCEQCKRLRSRLNLPYEFPSNPKRNPRPTNLDTIFGVYGNNDEAIAAFRK